MISMCGAGLAGLGAGVTLNNQLVGVVPLVMLLGIVLLALGMYGKFQIEREHINPPSWVLASFGLCWIGVMLGALYLLIDHYAFVVS